MTETDTCFKILRVQPEARPPPAPRFQGGQRALPAGTRGAAVPLGLGVAPSRRRSRRQGRPPIGTARARTHAPSRARRAALRPCPARPPRPGLLPGRVLGPADPGGGGGGAKTTRTVSRPPTRRRRPPSAPAAQLGPGKARAAPPSAGGKPRPRPPARGGSARPRPCRVAAKTRPGFTTDHDGSFSERLRAFSLRSRARH